jgi:hypothetical protein
MDYYTDGLQVSLADPASLPPRKEAMSNRPSLFLKRSLLLFWSIWLTVVFVTNVLDGCKALGWLGDNWPFASGNYRFLVETTARYGTPAWLNGLLFLGVIGWEGTAGLLFWLAWLRFRGKEESRRLLYTAFTVSLALWSTFAITDELCIAYAVEGTHLHLFLAQLVTLLAIELLPKNTPLNGPREGSGS